MLKWNAKRVGTKVTAVVTAGLLFALTGFLSGITIIMIYWH